MSNATKKAQMNALVRKEKDVKVIVLADGTVQVVDINATNADDDFPNAEPYVEIAGNKKGKVGVQQREVAEEELKPEETVKVETAPKKTSAPKTPRKTSKKAAEVKTNDDTKETTEDVTDSSVAE